MPERQTDLKEKILTTGIKLFLTNGYVGTSVRDLTDAVGIARGTLYWHFKSKDQILDEILERYCERFIDAAIETMNSCNGDFLTKFHVFYRFITEFARDNPELLMVFDTLLGEISRNGTDAANKMKEIRSRLGNSIESLLEIGQKEGLVGKDIDINLHAHIILATFTGMLLHWFVHEDSLDAVAYSRAFRVEILRGLCIESVYKVKKPAKQPERLKKNKKNRQLIH
jgi:AcrR family transcriptional regulator